MKLYNNKRTIINCIIITLIFIYFFFSFTYKINLANSDIGRHIKNGEIFIKEHKIIKTNYYSYTLKDNLTINHHWLSGVVYYIVQNYFGFTGLSIFNTLLNLIALLIFFLIAKKKTNIKIASFFTLLAIPLINFRHEVRPEGFSYFFLGLVYFILEFFNNKKLSFKQTLVLIIIIQILWVNMHIFFILGPVIISIYFVNEVVNKTQNVKPYIFFLIFSILSSLFNPWYINGLLEPLNIFKNYGYTIAENQSVLFMQKRFSYPVYYHFEILFILVLTLIFLLIRKKLIKYYLKDILLIIAFSLLSWRFIRGLSIFALFFITFSSITTFNLIKKFNYKLKQSFYFCIFSILSLVFLIIIIPNNYYSLIHRNFGLGTFTDNLAASEFFKQNKLHGPIFNNYDIGSYLIYTLFPQEKVFTDNRPEAYTTEFFQDTFIPMQEDENKWEEINNQYKFNIIYFYIHDLTNWGQEFMINRVKDPNWVPIFVDDYAIIFIKNEENNKEIIEKFEIQKDRFSIGKIITTIPEMPKLT